MRLLSRLGIAFLLLGVIPVAASPLLRNPLPIPLPDGSISDLLSADFNGDGHPDLLVVMPAQYLAVYIANGTGPFAPPVLTPLSSATGTPGVGDVNGDGKLDVVVSDWSTQTITVMLGAGDGSFTAGAIVPTISAPGPLAIGDLNGDGHADIAVASIDSHTPDNVVATYFGDSAGHLTTGASFVVFDLPFEITAADVNRDGLTDLIVSTSMNTEIHLGAPNGTFLTKSRLPAGRAICGDFNHDGNLDLALGAFQIELGNGNGTFLPAATYAAAYGSDSTVAADIDGDGNVDLLAAGTAGSVVTVLRGRPDGTFQPPNFFLSGPSAWKIAVGDFDFDGKPDFVTLDYNSEIWAMSFVRGNGDGSFQAYRAYHTATTTPVPWPGFKAHGGVVSDMNNDGKPDVVVIQGHSYAAPDRYDLGVLLNDGSGHLAAPILTDTAAQDWDWAPAFAIGDISGDGKQDAVVLSDLAYTPAAAAFLGDGTAHFGAAIPSSVPAFDHAPVLGHFTAGSALDLLIPAGNPVVLPGLGNGTFGPAILSNVEIDHVVTGDLNGDGKVDLVSAYIRSTNACLNDGTGRFNCSSVTGDEITAVALADFNDDGKLDLLFTTYTGTQVRFGNGDGTFGGPLNMTMSPVPNYPADPTGGHVVTADFDGDGHVDLAIGTSIYLGNGDGTFRARWRYRGFGTATGTADMNGDGSIDLVTVTTAGDDVDVITTRTAPDPTDTSSLVLTANSNTAEYAAPVTFTATVTGRAILLTGSVLFTIDGQPAALMAVDKNGIATFTTRFTIGSHAITARYTSDEYYLESFTSTNVSVVKAKTSLTIQTYPNPDAIGGTEHAIVQLSALATAPMPGPTGRLTIREGDVVLASVVLTSSPPPVTSIKNLTIGTHVITVDYPGDDNFEASTASTTQEIVPLPTIISVSPSSGPTSGGQLVTITGTNLTSTQFVYFDSPPSPFVVNSATSITAITPTHAAGGASVYVMLAPVGGAVARNGYTFEATTIGDVDGDGWIKAADVFALVNYLFGGAPPPPHACTCDVNGSGTIDAADVFYLLRYLFAQGPPPQPDSTITAPARTTSGSTFHVSMPPGAVVYSWSIVGGSPSSTTDREINVVAGVSGRVLINGTAATSGGCTTTHAVAVPID